MSTVLKIISQIQSMKPYCDCVVFIDEIEPGFIEFTLRTDHSAYERMSALIYQNSWNLNKISIVPLTPAEDEFC